MIETNEAIKSIRFEEDTFDLAEHKKAADAVTREKNRVNKIRRQVVVGKVIMAFAAFAIFFLIYYVLVATDILSLF